MAISQFRSKRKVSGGRYKSFRKKRKSDLGNPPTSTKLGKRKSKQVRVKGGSKKSILLRTELANVFNPTTKKYEKLKILTIVDNPANRHFVRRNIITKGTIIKTEKGNAKVLSRPAQHNTINAILLKTP